MNEDGSVNNNNTYNAGGVAPDLQFMALLTVDLLRIDSIHGAQHLQGVA